MKDFKNLYAIGGLVVGGDVFLLNELVEELLLLPGDAWLAGEYFLPLGLEFLEQFCVFVCVFRLPAK